MSSGFRGEVRPRRSGTRHHVEMNAANHRAKDVSDPFPPLSSKQFPAFYQRDPVKNQYRRYMSAKSAYKRPKF